MRTFRNFSMLNSVLFSLFILLLTSCGDRDDDKKDERELRIKQVTLRNISFKPQWQEFVDSVQFYYDTNNLIIAESGIREESITLKYDSVGRISIVKFMNYENEYNARAYSWAGNILTLTETDNTDRKTVFEINSEGRVKRMESYIYLSPDWYLHYYVLYTWANDNLVSTETWIAGANQSFRKESEKFYTYDTKINPFKDYQLYRFSEIAYSSSANNLISTQEKSFLYTYSTANYPLVMSEFGNDWSSTTTYFYE